MKKRGKLLKTLMLSLLCFLSVPLTSCGFLAFGQSDVIDAGIESFYLTPNEDGSTTLTITYFDEDREDDVFIIPAGGSEGIDGVSISNITITQISATECILTIWLQNSEDPYIEFIIPTGASIVDITISKTNPNSSSGYITVTFTDGTTQTVDIYYYAKGDTGFGITAMAYGTDGDGNITSVVILWSNNDTTTIPISSYQGKDGYSITHIDTYTDTENRLYHIYIYYNYPEGYNPEATNYDLVNGRYDISFAMPEEPSTWYNGIEPPDDSLGKDGDHYFDIKNVVIYEKKDGSWEQILALLDYYNENQKTVTITFDLNDCVYKPASMGSIYPQNDDGQYEAIVPYNSYFTSVGSIPIPTRQGYDNTGSPYSYTFMGWCSSKEASPVSGYLTDLTACCTDMTFFAIWEESV